MALPRRLRVLVRHEEARDAVLDLLERAVVGRGDHRQAGGAGLGDDVRHALVAREPDEDVEPRQKGRHVGAVAEEVEPPGEAERGASLCSSCA